MDDLIVVSLSIVALNNVPTLTSCNLSGSKRQAPNKVYVTPGLVVHDCFVQLTCHRFLCHSFQRMAASFRDSGVFNVFVQDLLVFIGVHPSY